MCFGKFHFLVELVLDVFGVRDGLYGVIEQGELFLKHLVLHLIQLIALLKLKYFILLRIDATLACLELVLAPSSQILIEVGNLPQNILILPHTLHKIAHCTVLIPLTQSVVSHLTDLLNFLLVLFLQNFVLAFESDPAVHLSLQRFCQVLDFLADFL